MSRNNDIASDPRVGIEWSNHIAADITNRIDEVPLLEIIPENFMRLFRHTVPKSFFDTLEKHRVPVLVHSVSLSLAAIEPFDHRFFNDLLDVMNQMSTAVSLSDHLCMTSKDGCDIGQLTPVPYNEATLDAVCRKLDQILPKIDVPFAIENITHNFNIPSQEMSEPEFIMRLHERTGIALLLDLNNIYTNGVNFGIDPWEWLRGIDLSIVDTIHLAGGYWDDDQMLQDGHCSYVPQPVWQLYEHVLRKAGRPIRTIVERTEDNAITGFEPVMEDQRKAQGILNSLYDTATPSQTVEESCRITGTYAV